jgi:N-acetylmuramoyl-L-alanine amidase
MFDMSAFEPQPPVRRVIDLVVIHCSATPPGRSLNVYDIDRMHRERGFRRQDAARQAFNPGLYSIGYHYLVNLDGKPFTGRAEAEIGAHVSGSNARSIGVCMVGMNRFTAAQWECLSSLVASLRSRYPGARVAGHRDLSPDLDGDGIVEPQEWLKECPTFDVGAWLRSGMKPPPSQVVPA